VILPNAGAVFVGSSESGKAEAGENPRVGGSTGLAMNNSFFYKDEQYLLNYCTKYLARFNTDARHTYSPSGQRASSDRFLEAWRFPLIDSYGGGAPGLNNPTDFNDYNEVTFIYAGTSAFAPGSVGVLGTFATLYDPIPLQRVRFEDEPTHYWSVTFAVPKGQKHTYRFLVDGWSIINDSINPQEETLENGVIWSRFFTEGFTTPLVLERWELDLLYRLVAEVLPFQTKEASMFLDKFYNDVYQGKQESYNNLYRLDDSAGEVNYIDNILAREERHRLSDYKICLAQIDWILRQRDPCVEPSKMSRDTYFHLYEEMASNNVPGWDYTVYNSPQFFLYLLRRHAVVGALSHPKYGGNTGAAGWAYLSERYPFDWRAAIEKPLGVSADYLG
jgi:hypothetical protein